MAYPDELKAALLARLPGKVVFLSGWSNKKAGTWKGKGKRPVALMLHHTAAAATDSTDPKHPGNQKGANNGIINYIQSHFRVPAASFTLDRDGTVYVHAAQPCWHAGLGSFKGKVPWSVWKIADNDANRWTLGVEIVSKGRKRDYTAAQHQSLGLLIQACSDASPNWQPLWLQNRPQHRNWTTRKIDLLYTNDQVKSWVASAIQLWDGKVPDFGTLMAGSTGSSVADDSTWRLACRLADLGHFSGVPVRGSQGYPRNAVAAWQKACGYKATGNYGPKAHELLFQVAP